MKAKAKTKPKTGQLIPQRKFKVKVHTIAPKKASEWLKKNRNNRPVREQLILRYAAVMEAGEWMLNGETIKFDINGDLIDGQHRLWACVRSNKSFECYVVDGLTSESFDSIDQGDKRTIGDVFARAGYKHYALLAAAVRWVWMYQDMNMHQRGSMRQDQAKGVLEKNPALHTAVSRACVLQKCRIIQPGLIAFLLYMTCENHDDKALSFWTSVCESEVVKGTPGYLLHKRLMGNLAAQAKLDSKVIAALCVKAWNAHITKKPLGALKWSPEEEFPSIL